MTEATTTASQPEERSGWSITRIAVAATAALTGVIVLIFILGLLLAINDVERAGLIVQLIRDYLLIVITLEGILILFAFAALIVQLARSINLVHNEVRPVLENTQEAVNAVKDTAEFVGRHAVGPVIRMKSFLAGLWVFLRELGGIRRAIRRGGK